MQAAPSERLGNQLSRAVLPANNAATGASMANRRQAYTLDGNATARVGRQPDDAGGCSLRSRQVARH